MRFKVFVASLLTIIAVSTVVLAYNTAWITLNRAQWGFDRTQLHQRPGARVPSVGLPVPSPSEVHGGRTPAGSRGKRKAERAFSFHDL
jgi:hypothetical protein